MINDPPEWDPKLYGHSALVRDGICHAITSGIDASEGIEYPTPACDAHDVTVRENKKGTGPRKSFVDDPDVEMCPNCWPESVIDE